MFSKIDLELDTFVPYLPVLTGHTQTILGHIVPSSSFEIVLKKKILKLSDGDQLLLEFIDNKSDYTISIYHGLAGTAKADYMQRSARIAQRLGWNIIMVNHRGAVSEAESKRSYHSGRGEDADAVVKWARENFKDTKQITLGFSMSGSILLNLLTERYGSEQPDYAVIVNAPLDLARCAHLLTQGLSKIYDYRFYFLLKKMISGRSEISLPIIGRTYDIDEIYTSRINGYKNANEYYEKCSTFNYLNRIKTKTFVLMAKDDPFIDVNDYLKAQWNDHAHLTIAEHGGHMGYFSYNKDSRYGRRWLDHYLESVFKQIKKI